ncbi:MAG: acyl-CoA dehydrogenase family protein [Anaerolineales bacterium]|nr:acyl-CoA dehydrogenase family protein [Anaerolineales bacterium]
MISYNQDPLFPLTDEEEALLALTHQVCRREILPARAELDETGQFPTAILRKFREVGLFAGMFEAEYGGLGLSPLMPFRIVETIAQYCLGVATTFGASTTLAALPIKCGGTEAQKQKYLPLLAGGEKLGALAVTEPDAGSDVLNLSTTAVKSGDYYVLNGVKQWITNAGQADIYCIFAGTGSIGGISCFIVEKDTPGLSFGQLENKLGIRCSHTRQLILQDVAVPVDNLIGLKPNRGLLQLLQTLARSRVSVAALSVGVATGAYHEAIKYTRQREQFGQKIIRFQALQHLLADMLVKIETARSLTYRAALYAATQHPQANTFSAMAKYYASEIAMQVTTDAVQLHGGYGYSKEYPVEKMFRDAKILAIYEGANQLLKNQIGDHIVRTAAQIA